MTDEELRALVRDAIARVRPSAHVGPVLSDQPGRGHASFALLNLPAGADTDGPCFIEPTVACNHCGYCKSYGH